MNASEIKDRETLRAWLETRPDADSIVIANRAALRAAPAWFAAMQADWALERDLTSLPVLRQNLTTGVARNYPTPEVRAAAAAAYDAAASPSHAFSAATTAASAASDAASYVASAASYSSGAAPASFAAADAAAYASDAAASSADAWALFRGDAEWLAQAQDMQGRALWPDTANLFQAEWDETRALWSAPNSPYAFWLRWYEAALQGRTLNPELERDIALIPDEDWEKGAEHIAGLIAEIEVRYARAATENGERIEFNPETQKLYLVGETDLPDDIAAYARRKITRALALFGDQPANQYTALIPDLAMLREAVNDAANLPVELFDACASASRRLSLRGAAGECPEPGTDPLLQDYQQRIREAGADILANDAKAQQVLERRNAILGNDALIREGEAVQAGVEKLLPVTEGYLDKALPNDAAIATNPAAPVEDRRAASYRLGSRVLKIVGWTSGAVAAWPSFLEGCGIIWRDPLVKWLVELILNYLGM